MLRPVRKGWAMGRWGAAGCAVLVVTALGACSDAREGSALILEANAGEICVPAPGDADVGTMFGGTWLAHQGDGALTFADIALLEADGLTLTEALLVPDPWPDGDLVGMRHTSDASHLPAEWADRVNVTGAQLRPGETRNLVVVVTTDGSDVAAASGIRVVYDDARGRRYHQDMSVTLMVATIPCFD